MRERAYGSLQLLAPSPSPPPVAVAQRQYVYEDRLRRPGELHEAVVIPPTVLRAVERTAAAVGVPSGTAARLLIETALVKVDLAALGRADSSAALDTAAAAAAVCRRLSAAEADYLRGLRHRHDDRRSMATLPLRISGRIEQIDMEAALTGDLSRALAWEAAALLAGRTMLEWALITVSGAR
jgi:hypothetical protein